MVHHNFRKGQKVYCILKNGAIIIGKYIKSTGHYLELDNYKILWKDTRHFRPNNRTFWTFQNPNSQTWGSGYNSNTKPNIAIKLCKNRFQKCPKNYKRTI